MNDIHSTLNSIRRLSEAGRYEEAEAEARSLLVLLPNAAETMFLLAYAVHRQDRLDEAVDLYELALRYAPNHASALNNLGSILRRQNKHAEALQHYRRAAQAQPDQSWIWSNYANSLIELGRNKEAIEALKRAAALAPEDDELHERLALLMIGLDGATNASGDPKQATEEMWRLNPAIADFDRMGFALRPYVERLSQPNYRSGTLTTDRHGFRRLISNGAPIDYDQFTKQKGPRGIICGASQAFGYGITDEDTVQAHLTRMSAGGAQWFSLAAPITQLLQQRLLFELFAPAETKYCVIISGTVNVLLSLLAPTDRAPFPPLHQMAYEWPSEDSRSVAGDIDRAFEQTLGWMQDNIRMFAARCKLLEDCRLLFCHPPVLPWTQKTITDTERRLCDLYRIRHRDYAALIEDSAHQARWQEYRQTLRETVEAVDGTYLEMSSEPAFSEEAALFCDAVHPNEAGAKIIANCVARWADAS